MIRDEVVMTEWTTRIPPEVTRRSGVEETHAAFFEPPNWPGKGPVTSILIPECETQYTSLQPDGEPFTVVNRPARNKNVKYWLRIACRNAEKRVAVLTLCCDTAEQVEINAQRVAKLLPRYRRVAMERMEYANARRRDGLA